MKHLLTLAIFIFSFSTMSQVNFDYKDLSITEPKLSKQRVINYEKTIKAFFSSEGFTSLSSKSLPELYFADYFFTEGESIVGVRFNIISPTKVHNKLLVFKDGYLYHSDVAGGLALYIKTKNKKRAKLISKSLIRKLKNTNIHHVRNSFVSNFVSTAYAADVACNPTLNTPAVDLKDHINIANAASTSTYLAMAKDCFMNALKGAWSSTGGLVSGAASGLFSFFQSPIKSAKKAWETGVQMVKTTGIFISNLKTHLASLSDIFSTMSGEAIAQVLCSIVGGIGGGALLAMLINPALGIAKVLVKLAAKIKHILKIKKLLSLTNRLGGVALRMGVSSKKVISNLVINTNQAFQATVRKLHQLGENKLMLRYAQCGI